VHKHYVVWVYVEIRGLNYELPFLQWEQRHVDRRKYIFVLYTACVVGRLLASRVNVTQFAADVHGLVQLPPTQGRHTDRDHGGGLSQRSQANVAARDHLRRAAAETGPRKDAYPQAVERQQSAAVYRKQRRPSRFHRLRRFVVSLTCEMELTVVLDRPVYRLLLSET